MCYVSRSLTDCDKREVLGHVWACERLHPYVYGRTFDLVTDHKPLEVIYTASALDPVPAWRLNRAIIKQHKWNIVKTKVTFRFRFCGA